MRWLSPLCSGNLLSFLMIAALVGFNLASVARAVEPSKTDAVMEDRVQARIPDIEDLDRFVERDVSGAPPMPARAPFRLSPF